MCRGPHLLAFVVNVFHHVPLSCQKLTYIWLNASLIYTSIFLYKYMLYTVIILFDLGEPFIFRSFSLHHRVIAMDWLQHRAIAASLGHRLLRLRLGSPVASSSAAKPAPCLSGHLFVHRLYPISLLSKLAGASRYLGPITYWIECVSCLLVCVVRMHSMALVCGR